MTRDDKIDALIADLDARIDAQVSVIRKHPKFKALRKRWRALRFLVDRIDFRENTQLHILNVSKEDLLMDFEDSPQVTKSGMYKIAYSGEYGPFGGRPYGVVLGDYRFDGSPDDMTLLQSCAAVVSVSCCIFVAAADPALVDSPSPKWEAFRNTLDARHTGLVYPPCRGRGVHAFGAIFARAFAAWRMSVNLTGPEYGRVDAVRSATALSAERAGELEASGFVPIRVEDGLATIASVMSCARKPPEPFGGLRPADLDVHGHLGWVSFISRLASYLKIMQREQIGSWKERGILQAQLSLYLDQFVGPGKPLRRVKLQVTDDAPSRSSGHYQFTMLLQPRWLRDGEPFNLWLRGKLDKE